MGSFVGGALAPMRFDRFAVSRKKASGLKPSPAKNLAAAKTRFA